MILQSIFFQNVILKPFYIWMPFIHFFEKGVQIMFQMLLQYVWLHAAKIKFKELLNFLYITEIHYTKSLWNILTKTSEYTGHSLNSVEPVWIYDIYLNTMPGKPTILESFTDSTFCSISTAARSASDAAGHSGSCVTSIISELMAYLSHAQRPRTVIVCSCLQLLSMTQLRALNINAPPDADIDFETSARSLFQLMLEVCSCVSGCTTGRRWMNYAER